MILSYKLSKSIHHRTSNSNLVMILSHNSKILICCKLSNVITWAGTENRTRVSSMANWSINHYAIPATNVEYKGFEPLLPVFTQACSHYTIYLFSLRWFATHHCTCSTAVVTLRIAYPKSLICCFLL